jgi:peroxiredoxin
MRSDVSPRVLLCFSLIFSAALLLTPGIVSAQNAPDFVLKDLDGNSVRLSDFRGKNVVLIDFWATWCLPCVKELPHFQRFYDTYRQEGLTVLAISVDGPESLAMVRPFMKRYGYTFPVLLDTDSEVIALYNPRVALPYTLLIDREGNIQKVHQGYSPGDEKMMEEELLRLLELRAPAAAGAPPVSFHFNEAFLCRNFSDENYAKALRGGRSSQVINQLDALLSYRDFLVGLRGDAYLDYSPLTSDISLAKRFLEFNHQRLSLRLGDYYQTVGRGLIFSLLKTFEKEGLEYIIDTTVDGGRFGFSHRAFSAEVYGGWVDREKDEAKDKVAGATVGWRYKSLADFKLNIFGARLEPGLVLGNKDVFMQSLSVDMPSIKNKAKFYAEFCLVQKKKYFSAETIQGHGVYMESGLFIGRLTALLEFKNYRNLDFEYNRPPMLESELVPILANQYAKDALDATGIAAKADYGFPGQEFLLFGRLAYIYDKSRVQPREILDVFVGGEKKFKGTGWLNMLAGTRDEETSSLIYYYTNGRTWYVQANLSYPVTGRFSLEADFKDKAFNGVNLDYYERRSFLSFLYSPRWALTVFFDQTDDPEILFFKDKKDWWGVQLEYKFYQANFRRIFYGSNKGGVKCSGGVCKFFPPFEGLRVDAMIRF